MVTALRQRLGATGNDGRNPESQSSTGLDSAAGRWLGRFRRWLTLPKTSVETRHTSTLDVDSIRILAEQLQEAFALYGPDGRLLVANQEYIRLHSHLADFVKPGMPFEDMIRASIELGYIADAVGREEEHIRQRLAQHRNPSGPILRTLTDGTSYLIKESRLPDGSVAVTQTDVSELTQAKEALRSEQQRFEELVKTASDWFWETDDQYRFTDVTVPVGKIGISPDEMRGKTRWQLAGGDPATDPHWAAHLANLEARRPFRDFRYSTELPLDQEAYHRVSGQSLVSDAGQLLGYRSISRNDGGRLHFSVSGQPVHDDSGKFTGYCGTTRDVTEEVVAGEQARAAHQRLLDAIECLPESFVLYDKEDRVVLCNSASHNRMPWGKTPIQPGMTFEDMMHEIAYSGLVAEARGREEEWVRESVESHRNPVGPREIHRTDGRWVLISERTTSDGGTVSIRMDVTEQKRAQIDRETAMQKAEEANRAKTNFLANMSHELRTPLNAIIGMSEMMGQRIFGPLHVPQYENYVESISTAGRHLLDLVNDMLDISRIESGHYTFTPQPVDPVMVIEDCRRIVLGQPGQDHPDVLLEIPATLPMIHCDLRALRQILLHLMGNAARLTPRGGKVVVDAAAEDGFLTIRLVNSGAGLDKSELDQLIRPFEQSERDAYTAPSERLGLGLAISDTLAKRLGGDLVIESQPGEGITMRLRLPRLSDRSESGRALA